MIRQQFARLFPVSCVICSEADTTGHNLCQFCAASLPVFRHSCHLCAVPLMTERTARLTPEVEGAAGLKAQLLPKPETRHTLCGQCLVRKPPLRRTVCCLGYLHPTTSLIHQYKFGGRLLLAHTFAQLLLGKLDTTDSQDIDCIIPIPLSRQRMLQRGFNQAEEIARPVAVQLRVPMFRSVLVRPGTQVPQVELDRSKRQKNVAGVFSVTGDISGLRCVLVDDVMTTGATLYEAARTLLAAGASSVDAWVIARTP